MSVDFDVLAGDLGELADLDVLAEQGGRLFDGDLDGEYGRCNSLPSLWGHIFNEETNQWQQSLQL